MFRYLLTWSDHFYLGIIYCEVESHVATELQSLQASNFLQVAIFTPMLLQFASSYTQLEWKDLFIYLFIFFSACISAYSF
jgi:hypothetical protein